MAAAAGLVALAGISAYSQAQAAEAQGDFQRRMGDVSEQYGNMQAEDAIARGKKDSADYMTKVKSTVGSQRAALASQGVDINSGSAAALQEDTLKSGAEDAMTIQNNAWREAFGYRVQAANAGATGRFQQMAGRNEARNTMITGAARAGESGYKYYRG